MIHGNLWRVYSAYGDISRNDFITRELPVNIYCFESKNDSHSSLSEHDERYFYIIVKIDDDYGSRSLQLYPEYYGVGNKFSSFD